MIQVVSLIGALGVLTAYIAIQTKRVDAENSVYQALNLAGSIALAVAAIVMLNLGVILLNVIWAIVSFRALLVGYRYRKRAGRAAGSDA
jgi:hypothetical protein